MSSHSLDSRYRTMLVRQCCWPRRQRSIRSNARIVDHWRKEIGLYSWSKVELDDLFAMRQSSSTCTTCPSVAESLMHWGDKIS